MTYELKPSLTEDVMEAVENALRDNESVTLDYEYETPSGPKFVRVDVLPITKEQFDKE